MAMASGSKCKLLSTIILDASSKTCQIPMDAAWFGQYKWFVVSCHIEYPSGKSEWLYFDFNSAKYSDGQYVNVSNGNTGIIDTILSAFVSNGTLALTAPNNVTMLRTYPIELSDNFLRVNLYTNDLSIGTEFRLYGLE